MLLHAIACNVYVLRGVSSRFDPDLIKPSRRLSQLYSLEKHSECPACIAPGIDRREARASHCCFDTLPPNGGIPVKGVRRDESGRESAGRGSGKNYLITSWIEKLLNRFEGSR
jgi:hypothetical protein